VALTTKVWFAYRAEDLGDVFTIYAIMLPASLLQSCRPGEDSMAIAVKQPHFDS
jgi:hypothetical protein